MGNWYNAVSQSPVSGRGDLLRVAHPGAARAVTKPYQRVCGANDEEFGTVKAEVSQSPVSGRVCRTYAHPLYEERTGPGDKLLKNGTQF